MAWPAHTVLAAYNEAGMQATHHAAQVRRIPLLQPATEQTNLAPCRVLCVYQKPASQATNQTGKVQGMVVQHLTQQGDQPEAMTP
jgi:hypothetical protein